MLLGTIFAIAIFLGLYGLGWVTAIRMREKYIEWNQYLQFERKLGHIFLGVLWPVYIPIFSIIMFGMGRMRLPSLSVPKKIKQGSELFPGVERPSFILAQMVAARIVQNYVGLEYQLWSDNKVTLSWNYMRLERSLDKAKDFYITVKGKQSVRIGDTDKESIMVLRKALIQAQKMKEEKEEADRISKLEHEALSVIETLTIGSADGSRIGDKET